MTNLPWTCDCHLGDVIVPVGGQDVELHIHDTPTAPSEIQALRVILRHQARELAEAGQLDAKTAAWIHCPCGRRLTLSNTYRCLFCGLRLCRDCATIHFGERTH